MKQFTFRRLHESDGTWAALKDDWASQCSELCEDFEQFATDSIPVLEALAAQPETNASVYGLVCDKEKHHAVAQLNRAMLPGTSGWTLRVRHLILSPDYDFGALLVDDYAIAIGNVLLQTLAVAHETMPSDHVKFHLRSPADRSFFATLSSELSGITHFKDVRIVGAWLQLSLASR